MPAQKRLLIVAFHFPPIQASTGVTRTLSFAKYLKNYGWEVTVLTATPGAYPEIRNENLAAIPDHVRVERALAFDTQRHLSILGRYPAWLAIPDRWQSWRVPAIAKAADIVKRWRPTALMSTYPIATAHRIAAAINRRFAIPWIADFRDPMAQPGYPADPATYRSFERIETEVFTQASRVVVTTPGTATMYRNRYANFPPDHISVVPNGFDPEMFPVSLEPARSGDSAGRQVTLLHSGIVYPVERNPTALLEAIGELRRGNKLTARNFRLLFRASAHEHVYRPQVDALGIGELVHFLPPIPYRDAIQEMCASDAFLLLQASSCNDQIPAKVYEYLYCERPIFALTDPRGDTAGLLRSVGSTSIARLDDKDEIKVSLMSFIEQLREGSAPTPPRDRLQQFSRQGTTQTLAKILDELA